MADNTVKFITTTYSAYSALVVKDVNALYFLEDVGRLIKGSTKFSEVLVEVDTLPLAPIEGKIYVLPTLEGFMYKNSEWTKVFSPVASISTSYSLLFNINTALSTGIIPIPEKAIENGTIRSIDIVATTAGATDAEIDIQKISEADMEVGGFFASIFTAGNDLKVPTGKFTNKSAAAYELVSNSINKGDILRLNVINSGSGLAGITLQIKIDL